MNKISDLHETIIALCTPQGKGALALLRICGSNANSIVQQMAMLSAGKIFSALPSHTIHYGSIVDQKNESIDKVLFLVMHAPHTFTGQDTIEISCHNNPFIIEAIINSAIHHGARLANPGEFTQRAVLNEKIDLIQAEAIDELIHANTQLTLKKALAQLEGSFSRWVTDIEQQLITCLALSEASFEFIDEEHLEFGNQIAAHMQTILTTITHLKKTFDMQQHIRQGIRIALVGTVNAGKSSLFNTFIGKKRSIVTNIAGTTRDSIEAGLYKNGNYWTLIDTAGLRYSEDIIEKEGIERSLEEAQKADILLLIFDSSRQLNDKELSFYTQLISTYNHKIITIHTKVDLPAAHGIASPDALPFSIVTPGYLASIEEAIQTKINALFAAADSPFLLNQRQFNVLMHLEKKLIDTLPLLFNRPICYEILSIDINEMVSHFAQLTGKSISQIAMNEVFRTFCVGK